MAGAGPRLAKRGARRACDRGERRRAESLGRILISFCYTLPMPPSSLKKKYGTPPFLSEPPGEIFPALVRSITYQQLSGKAAASIHGRVLQLFPKKKPTPKHVKETSQHALRAAGLSAAKVLSMHDAAEKFLDGSISTKRFPKMTSDEIIEHLIQIRGVGEWTAHMLLIFTLHRPDILPTGDLGIRKGFQAFYNLDHLPNKKEMEVLAVPWRHEASLCSLYLWRVADEAK